MTDINWMFIGKLLGIFLLVIVVLAVIDMATGQAITNGMESFTEWLESVQESVNE